MGWKVMDATKLTFEDQSFDLVLDKGTIDAIICGDSISPVLQIMKEMLRTTKHGGYTLLITNANPQSRRLLYEDSVPTSDFKTRWGKVMLNDKADLINIMRHNLKNQPLNMIMKDKDLLLKSMVEYKLSTKLRERRRLKGTVLEDLEYENCEVIWRVEERDVEGNQNLKDGAEIKVGNSGKNEDDQKVAQEQKPEEKEETEVQEKQEAPEQPEENQPQTDDAKPKAKSYVKVNDAGYAPVRQNHCFVYFSQRLGSAPTQPVAKEEESTQQVAKEEESKAEPQPAE